MVRWLLAFLAFLLLSPIVHADPVTIPDPGVYLTQYQCVDGRFPTYCQGQPTVPVDVFKTLGYRRADWGRPGGWVLADAFHWPNSPWYGLDWTWPGETQNNGGEVYEITPDGRVRILYTRDNTSAKDSPTGNQYFNPCGGDGWVAFTNTAPTGRWATAVFKQNGGYVPTDCSNGPYSAYTRWRLEDMFVPWLIDGNRVDLFQHIVISEQWNNATMDSANRIERFGFAFGFGRIFWSLCLKDNKVHEDLGYRFPRFPFSECPAGFRLADARLATQVISTPPTTPAAHGWP